MSLLFHPKELFHTLKNTCWVQRLGPAFRLCLDPVDPAFTDTPYLLCIFSVCMLEQNLNLGSLVWSSSVRIKSYCVAPSAE